MIEFHRAVSSSFQVRWNRDRGIEVESLRQIVLSRTVWRVETGYEVTMDHRTGLTVSVDPSLTEQGWLLMGPSLIARPGPVQVLLANIRSALSCDTLPSFQRVLCLTPTRLVSGIETDLRILEGSDDFGGSVVKQAVVRA